MAFVPGGDCVEGGARVGVQGRAHPQRLQEGPEDRGGGPPQPNSSQGRHHPGRSSETDKGEYTVGRPLSHAILTSSTGRLDHTAAAAQPSW